MEEQVLIKSTRYNVKRIVGIVVIIGAVLSLIGLLTILIYVNSLMYDSYIEQKYYYEQTYRSHQWYFDHSYDEVAKSEGDCYKNQRCEACQFIIDSTSQFEYTISSIIGSPNRFRYHGIDWWDFEDNTLMEFLILSSPPFIIFSLISALLYWLLRNYEMIVTDKRVFGRVAWGKRVDLPVDSVSAIASVSVWKGVSVSTSSGKIKFLLMKNADEIYNILNNLLIERQQKKNEASSAKESNNSVADELKKYKELLDSGIISEAEFEAKKKQLLGL